MGNRTGRVAILRLVIAAVGLTPFVPLLFPGTALATVLGSWFGFQCHTRLDRTMILVGRYFPVCSRCLGIYLGLAVGALLPLPGLSRERRRAWLFAAAALMVVEVIVQDTMRHEPWHPVRILTGILLSWPVAQILIAAARDSTKGGDAAGDVSGRR